MIEEERIGTPVQFERREWQLYRVMQGDGISTRGNDATEES
jgi:hypothetical protein